MEINTQKPTSYERSNGLFLKVHSIFMTIQGEGPFSGHPAVFVRLAGCNLACPFCDTEYTENIATMSIPEIQEEIIRLHTINNGLVVVTGGEPFRQNITRFCNMLVTRGHTVQIETNGTLPVSGALDTDVHIVCSPKTASISETLSDHTNLYFKYVLAAGDVNSDDGLPYGVLRHPVRVCVARPFKQTDKIYVSPMDEKDKEANKLHMKRAVKSSMDHGYILSLQTHKIIGVK